MPVTLVFYKGRANCPEVLQKLREELPRILSLGLSTSEHEVQESSINIIFQEGNPYNVGRDLIIMPLANDLSERKEKIDEISQLITNEVRNVLREVAGPNPDVLFNRWSQRKTVIEGFIYVFLGAGGVGVI